jgi:hypothetical protein
MKHLKTFENYSPINEEISFLKSLKNMVKNAEEFFTNPKNKSYYKTNFSEFEKYLAFYKENPNPTDECGKKKLELFKKMVAHIEDNENAKFQLSIPFDKVTDENCKDLNLIKTTSHSTTAGVGGDSGHKH